MEDPIETFTGLFLTSWPCAQLECRVPLSLGVRVNGIVMCTLIQQNTVIPTRITKSVASITSGNRELGKLFLSGLAPAGRCNFDLTFEIDANGFLNVAADYGGLGKLPHLNSSKDLRMSMWSKVLQ